METLAGVFFGQGDTRRAWTRALAVVGRLLLVLAWRLDNSVPTAYDSVWTGRTIKLANGTGANR
jgi:hypothetical protein